MRALPIAILAIASLASTALARAEESTGTVYGRVYSIGSHKPICGAPVRLYSNREPTQGTRTRSDGSFSFISVFPGYVTVVVDRSVQHVEVHASLESDATFYVRGHSFGKYCPGG